MKIAFRVDASIQMGTGHVMRCLTLADALKSNGSECVFICRAHAGNLIELIQSKGYVTHALPIAAEHNQANGDLAHSKWLGATQDQDAELCAAALGDFVGDWLIVDHYALDIRWEKRLAPHYGKLMVIDDLADRQHACNVLLDQTFGRSPADYQPLVPANCNILCGAQYALLRPEFAALRHYSLQRRAQPVLHELLISMGGVDKDNATGQVLQALCNCHLPAGCRIKVVMGATAPWLNEVKKQAQQMPWPTQVLVDVNNMAQLMADSDLAIGAAGATSWERCCLGLPTIMLVLATNQNAIAKALQQAGATKRITLNQEVSKELSDVLFDLIDAPAALPALSKNSARIVDGMGTNRLADIVEA